MRVVLISKGGNGIEFLSCKAAKPYIKKEKWNDYSIIEGKRIYDDREDYEVLPIE